MRVNENETHGAVALAPDDSRSCPGRLCCSPRPDLAFDLTSQGVPGGLQVVIRLEVRPELGTRSKVPRQPKRRIRGDATPLVDDIRDSRDWYAQGHGHFVHAQPERGHEFFAENLSGMDRF